jgi:putative ABC transport system permease protein
VSGVRAALRIARRDAVRSKGRSALVVAMIAVPMLGLAFADVAARTAQLPPAEQARRELGGADLTAELVASGPITQRGLWDIEVPADKHLTPNGAVPVAAEPPPEPDLLTLLPAGSRAVARRSYYEVAFGAGDRQVTGHVEQYDAADPLNEGLLRLRAGTYPQAAGEVALTEAVAEVLRVRPGGTVTLHGAARRVTGVVVLPSSLEERVALVPPAATVPAGPARADATITPGKRWAVALPAGVRDLDVLPALNKRGFRVSPRTWYFDPPPLPGGRYVDAESVGVAVVAVGLATLEIVLLAGTAFAVGARRRQRELALLAATGGDRKDVRRVVLAGGLVLGVVAGALGAAAGVAAAFLARPQLDRLSGSLLGPLDVRPLELGAIVLVAVVTGLLAAALPARAASRQPVVTALTGRRMDARARARVPYVPLVMIVAGAALAFWAAGDGYVPDPGLDQVASDVAPGGSRPARFNLLLLGAVVAELGFVACAPSLVWLVGRVAKRLPLSLRLAARDAARHRTRSGPAVAAVVAAVAGSVAVSVYLASDTEKQRRAYEPRMPVGAVWVGRGEAYAPVSDAAVREAMAKLPVRAVAQVGQVAPACAGNAPCSLWRIEPPAELGCERDKDGCRRLGMLHPGEIVVGDAAVASWWAGRDAAGTLRRAGGALVTDERWLRDGHVVLSEVSYADGAERVTRTVRVPAGVLPVARYGQRPGLILTPEAARAHQLPTATSGTLLVTSRTPTGAEEAAARKVLMPEGGGWVDLHVERGFRRENALALLALVAASTVVTVGATAIATGLAAADSRPDLATLAAVGAAPRVRRRLAMAQAATVAALGSGLGILAGLVPAVAVVAARAEVPLDVPWATLATTAVGVPFLAALVIGALTRSRLPLARRLA